MADDNFFAMPPSEAPASAPPMPEGDFGNDYTGGDFTMIGDAQPSEAPPMVGTVDETHLDMGFGVESSDPFALPPADGGYALPLDDGYAPPMDSGYAPPMDGGYAPPDGGGYDAPDVFAAPSSDAPIILGGPPPIESPPEEAPPVVASAMQKWNEEWQATLTTRKDEENAKKAEMVEAARLAMEKFQKERETKREARMAKNREDEQAKLEAIEADLENDNSWQRVSKMVELTHDGAGNTEDTKRMRDILILLKNEPARAGSVGA